MSLIYEKTLNKPIGTTVLRIYNGSISSVVFGGQGCQFSCANMVIFCNFLYIYRYTNRYTIKDSTIEFLYDDYYKIQLPNTHIEDNDFYSKVHTACSLYFTSALIAQQHKF